MASGMGEGGAKPNSALPVSPVSGTAPSSQAKVSKDQDEATEEDNKGQNMRAEEEEATDDDEVKESSQPNIESKPSDGPPLPEGSVPPLPEESLPAANGDDDGWAPVWEPSAEAFYFYNRFTGASQWTNPRVPEEPVTDSSPPLPGAPPTASAEQPAGGYNPAVHGDYDPNAWYAQPATTEEAPAKSADPNSQYAATAAFNRFTGRFQNADLNPENFNDENKSKRQMNAFFDVDAAANSHEGKSLKAERSGKKLSKTELKQFKEKRKAKKEEKRRAWLRD